MYFRIGANKYRSSRIRQDFRCKPSFLQLQPTRRGTAKTPNSEQSPPCHRHRQLYDRSARPRPLYPCPRRGKPVWERAADRSAALRAWAERNNNWGGEGAAEEAAWRPPGAARRTRGSAAGRWGCKSARGRSLRGAGGVLGRGARQNRVEKRGAAHPCPARPVPLGGSCPKQDAAGPGILVRPAPDHCRAGPGKSSPKLEAAPSGCRGRAASGRWDEPGCRIQERENNPQTRENNN